MGNSDHIKEMLASIKNSSEINLLTAEELFDKEESYFVRHKARTIRTQAEDQIRLISAIEELLAPTPIN